jgi:hypothetical protein
VEEIWTSLSSLVHEVVHRCHTHTLNLLHTLKHFSVHEFQNSITRLTFISYQAKLSCPSLQNICVHVLTAISRGWKGMQGKLKICYRFIILQFSVSTEYLEDEWHNLKHLCNCYSCYFQYMQDILQCTSIYIHNLSSSDQRLFKACTEYSQCCDKLQNLIIQTQWNPHFRFLWGSVNSNTQLRKILNGRNLTLRVLTWDQWNSMLNVTKYETDTH